MVIKAILYPRFSQRRASAGVLTVPPYLTLKVTLTARCLAICIYATYPLVGATQPAVTESVSTSITGAVDNLPPLPLVPARMSSVPSLIIILRPSERICIKTDILYKDIWLEETFSEIAVMRIADQLERQGIDLLERGEPLLQKNCDPKLDNVTINQTISPYNGKSGYKVEVSVTKGGASWSHSVTRDKALTIPELAVPQGEPYWNPSSDMNNTIESLISSIEWERLGDKRND